MSKTLAEAIQRKKEGERVIEDEKRNLVRKQDLKNMKKNFIWMSFDLGVQGDYEGMYSWLDTHDARECGDSVAALEFEYGTDLLNELRKALETSVKIDKKTRIYVLRLVSGKMKGRFIFGARKSPPWAGYGPKKGEEEEDVT